jgi:hypothetical protein
MLFQYVIYEDGIASQADDLQLDTFACFLSFLEADSFLAFRVSHVGGRGHELPGKNMTMDMIFQNEMNFASLHKVKVALNMCPETEKWELVSEIR